MHFPQTCSSTTGPCNISDVAPRFDSTKLAAVVIRAALTLAVLAALLSIAVLPAHAQTETVLYNFCTQPNCSDGAYPLSNLTFDAAGNLFGATGGGGLWGYGTVFELSPNGSGGWNESVLYSFTGVADGAYPEGPVIFDSVGNLYGTANEGGAYGYGVVFELSPVLGGWTETALYSFANDGDGANPSGGVIMDPAGNLYGTTLSTVFELSPSGGGWTEQVIYAVGSGRGLVMDAAGNIFGTTFPTVFMLSPNGNGGWTPTVIHTFPSGPRDGDSPQGALTLDGAGNVYGATYGGGTKNWGIIFMLSPVTQGKKKGEWKERILYSFPGQPGACQPIAGVVLDARGNIYGTTRVGGKYQKGDIYERTVYGWKGQIWSFNGTDGELPTGSLILDGAGNLYGTSSHGGSTYGGSSAGYGVVFEVTP